MTPGGLGTNEGSLSALQAVGCGREAEVLAQNRGPPEDRWHVQPYTHTRLLRSASRSSFPAEARKRQRDGGGGVSASQGSASEAPPPPSL